MNGNIQPFSGKGYSVGADRQGARSAYRAGTPYAPPGGQPQSPYGGQPQRSYGGQPQGNINSPGASSSPINTQAVNAWANANPMPNQLSPAYAEWKMGYDVTRQQNGLGAYDDSNVPRAALGQPGAAPMPGGGGPVGPPVYMGPPPVMPMGVQPSYIPAGNDGYGYYG